MLRLLIVRAVPLHTQYIRCDKMKLWSDEQMFDTCFSICLGYRQSKGLRSFPREKSCETDFCKEGCPLAPPEPEEE